MNDSDIPESEFPPEPIEPELEQSIVWFIKKRNRLAWVKGKEECFISNKILVNGIVQTVNYTYKIFVY